MINTASSDDNETQVIETVFFTTKGNIKYIFKNGKEAPFVGLPEGKYATSVDWEIEELMHEIKNAHPFIHQKDGQETQIAGETVYEAMKKKMREDILAEIAAETARANDATKNVSVSVTERLKATTTANVASAAAGSSSAAS